MKVVNRDLIHDGLFRDSPRPTYCRGCGRALIKATTQGLDEGYDKFSGIKLPILVYDVLICEKKHGTYDKHDAYQIVERTATPPPPIRGKTI